MKEKVIEFVGVTKEFVFWRDRPQDLKKILVSLFRKDHSKKTVFRVLDDVSFAVTPGEFVGIMGRNGAGKSTILKLIAGVYAPTSGVIRSSGKISPVLELGAGFVPELSGYENIFINASILGYGKAKTLECLEQIIEFAELGEHIYAPVRNYSSGMLVRLAFSIAAHLDAPILLFDEVLAVGDIGFQEKCLRKINELHRSGRSIILVTHSPRDVVAHCTRCILIDRHKIIYDGLPEQGALLYQEEFR